MDGEIEFTGGMKGDAAAPCVCAGFFCMYVFHMHNSALILKGLCVLEVGLFSESKPQ